MATQKFGLVFNSISEKCVDQIKTHQIYLVEDNRFSWQNQSVSAISHSLIEGENYHALYLLQDTYLAKIDVIYIDPPYNTGNKDFVYNDIFVDHDDIYRHGKWLSFMEKRLILARKLLTDSGVILISIDDHEFAQLKLLCDDIFQENNFIGIFNWQTKNAARGVPPKSLLIPNHEFILCYCKQASSFKGFRGDDRSYEDFHNPDGDSRGSWRSESMRATGYQKNFFDIVDPETGNRYHGNWAFSENSIQDMIRDKKILFPKIKTGTPRQKKHIGSYTNDTKAITTSLGLFSTENGTKELINIFDGEKVFNNPKPLPLIKKVLYQATSKNSIILDFFAGSGTTGQAVQELNREDGGTRQFILVNNNDISPKLPQGICRQVAYPRLEKTIKHDTNLRYFRIALSQR